MTGLGVDKSEMPQSTDFKVMDAKFTEIFLTKTCGEWTEVFKDLDACFAPVLEMTEAFEHQHNKELGTFIHSKHGHTEPAPAPHLSRTPGVGTVEDQPEVGQHTLEELLKLGYTGSELNQLIENGVLQQSDSVKSKL